MSFFSVCFVNLLRKRYSVYLGLCCLFFSTITLADHDIHVICKKSPNACLAKIDNELTHTKQQSRLWFNLLQYKLDSLFNLRKISRLKENIAPWIDAKDLPIPFQISVYIYHIKTMPKDTPVEEKQRYIDKAKTQVNLLNNVYPNPIKLVELANLQIIIGEVQEGYKRLQALAAQYSRRNDPYFQMELYANLGHAANKLKLVEEKIDYYIKSLEWAIEFNNQQQIAVAYYNVAKSQFIENQLTQAINSFNNSVKYAHLANDHVLHAQAQYFLAKSYATQKQYKHAHNVLTQIQIANMPSVYKAPFKELLQLTQRHVN